MNATNIWCVGRNYQDHAKELNNPIPEKPLIFLKAGTCARHGKQIHLPTDLGEIHHECEIAVQLNQAGEPKAFTVGLDLTAREKQTEAKKRGEPWTLAKSFRDSCPLGPWIPWVSLEHFESLELQFHVNGELRQKGFTQQMIFPLPELLTYLLRHFPVTEGDVLMTGTPAGVGPLKIGDQLQAKIMGHPAVTWDVIKG